MKLCISFNFNFRFRSIGSVDDHVLELDAIPIVNKVSEKISMFENPTLKNVALCVPDLDSVAPSE